MPMGRDPHIADDRESLNATGDPGAVISARCTLRFLFRSPSNSGFLPIQNGRPIVRHIRPFTWSLLIRN